MKRSALFALVAFNALASSSAGAQNAKDFSTVRFYPAVGPNNYIQVEGARVQGHLRPSYGVFFDYSASTLVADRPCDGIPNTRRCENDQTRFVAGTGLVHLMASVSVADRTQLSIDLPLGFTDAERFFTQVNVSDGRSPSRTFAPRQGFTFADARLAAKTRLWESRNEQLALAATVFSTLPTAMITSNGDCRDAESCAFTGERGVNAGAQAVGEYRIANFRAAINVGAAYRPRRKFVTRETGSELLYGVGAEYGITPLVHVKGEVVGAVNLLGVDDYPIEARGALSYGRDLLVMAGGGGGLYGEVGSPSYRVFAGVTYTPMVHDADRDGLEDDVDACPSEPEDRDGFRDTDGCPEPDNDGDGVPDSIEKCDDQREDVDGFEDEDGCPELDNDRDGVQDGYDSCEGLKEDRDGDRDDDGCPDFDSDRDGVEDRNDRCPNQAEDTDGLADEDGCPEDDYDGDGLKDTDDGCSDQPETWNGILDEDGCPEDDADKDTVPDQVDACEGQQETLNAMKDGDGCPDGAAVIKVEGQVIAPSGPIQFDEKDHLTIEKPLLTAVADFVKRNHKRGTVRVVLTAPQGPAAGARAELFSQALARRTQREVTSSHVPGTPSRLQIELVPPGLKALPAPLGAAPQPPTSEPPRAVDPAAPSSGTPVPTAPGATPPASSVPSSTSAPSPGSHTAPNAPAAPAATPTAPAKPAESAPPAPLPAPAQPAM